MAGAFGPRPYGAVSAKCASRGKPAGRMASKSITSADASYEAAKGAVDFIKKYIFPGSCIPSQTVLRAAARQSF